jgi:ketosteroid isomerase-like protein
MRYILLMLSLAALATPARAADLKAEIEGANQKWIAAYGKGDAAALTALYTDKATVLPPGTDMVRGHDAILKFWQGAIQSGLKIDSLQPVSVEHFGTGAREIGRVTAQAPNAQKQLTRVEGKYVVVWKKVKGNWKLDTDIWNLNQ